MSKPGPKPLNIGRMTSLVATCIHRPTTVDALVKELLDEEVVEPHRMLRRRLERILWHLKKLGYARNVRRGVWEATESAEAQLTLVFGE